MYILMCPMRAAAYILMPQRGKIKDFPVFADTKSANLTSLKVDA
jgi:hypothetical protein